MASTVAFDCPVCGLPLPVTTVTPKEGARNGSTGSHVHMEVRGLTQCVNAHEWEASGDFVLTRTR